MMMAVRVNVAVVASMSIAINNDHIISVSPLVNDNHVASVMTVMTVVSTVSVGIDDNDVSSVPAFGKVLVEVFVKVNIAVGGQLGLTDKSVRSATEHSVREWSGVSIILIQHNDSVSTKRTLIVDTSLVLGLVIVDFGLYSLRVFRDGMGIKVEKCAVSTAVALFAI